jgi:omega-6 fatty acid desaturase (delta-12 desaturase)
VTIGPAARERSSLEWARLLSGYGPDPARSLGELALNVALYLGAWAVMIACFERAYLVSLLVAVPTAGLVLRIFSIQHDCGHGSFFRSPRANRLVGRLLSPISLVPYGYWRAAHARHHATVGKLDGRGMGDIALLTVREYRARPFWRRLRYRVYRHPLVMFGIGPAYQFYVRFRLPYGLPAPVQKTRASILWTDLALIGLCLGLHLTLGFGRFLALYLPMMTLAATAGVWLFYVHHEFETTYWRRGSTWHPHRAALEGASYYALPRLLRWFTGNTTIHHVHHLCCRIPNYRLPQCLRDHPALAEISRIGFRESLACARLALWDEERQRLVSFTDAARSRWEAERSRSDQGLYGQSA